MNQWLASTLSVELAIALTILSIIAILYRGVREVLTAVLSVQHAQNRTNLNQQRIAIRLTNVERYLETRTEFIGSGLETGLDDP